MCQSLRVLPREGGLLDQDSFLMAGMDMVVDAQHVRDQLDRGQAEQEQKRLGSGQRPVMR